jgi:serine/threonine protein kinase
MPNAEYRLVAKKGEGTFSEVLKAQCIKNGKYVAIKCMKNHFDSLGQVGGSYGINAEAAGRVVRPTVWAQQYQQCWSNATSLCKLAYTGHTAPGWLIGC